MGCFRVTETVKLRLVLFGENSSHLTYSSGRGQLVSGKEQSRAMQPMALWDGILCCSAFEGSEPLAGTEESCLLAMGLPSSCLL